MAITNNAADNERKKFVESSTISGQPVVAVANVDGTAIGAAPGTGTSANQTQGTASSNSAAIGKPVLVGVQYNATPQTFDDGDVATLQSDVNGNEKVTLATSVAGEDIPNDVLKVEQRFSSSYISTATTTTTKTGVGFLHSVTVQGGTAGTIIIYDNTAASGTILASFDSTNALASYIFDLSFSVGLTIITSAATKLTVSYR